MMTAIGLSVGYLGIAAFVAALIDVCWKWEIDDTGTGMVIGLFWPIALTIAIITAVIAIPYLLFRFIIESLISFVNKTATK